MRCLQSSPNLSSEERFSFPPRPSRTSIRCPCRPGWVCFSFSACSLPLLFEFSPERSPVLFRRKRRILRIRGLLLAVALATAAHNWLTRLQRGRFRALVVSFPYPSSKPHKGPHRAELGISPLFPGMFLPWQSCQLAFQVVVDSFLNGEDRVKQRPVSRSAVQCPHRCRQRFDEILIL